MKRFSQEKLNNMKDHFSQHKKNYGIAALTLVAGTIFPESVFADGEGAGGAIPSSFEGGYEVGVNWFKKGSRLAIGGSIAIGLVTAIAAGNLIRAGLFAVLGFCGISFLKFIWLQLETMFG